MFYVNRKNSMVVTVHHKIIEGEDTERQKSCTTYIFVYFFFKLRSFFEILKLGLTYAYNFLYLNVCPSNLSFVVLSL